MNKKEYTFKMILLCLIMSTITEPVNSTYSNVNHHETILDTIKKVLRKDRSLSSKTKTTILKAAEFLLVDETKSMNSSQLVCIQQCLCLIKNCIEEIKETIGQPGSDSDCDLLDCNQLQTVFQFLTCACKRFDATQSKVCETVEIIDDMLACNCFPISNSDLIGGSYTITTPGCYCLSDEINGTIVIDADDVTLDLNHHRIFNVASDCIDIATGHTNITIQNGRLVAECSAAIHLHTETKIICIQDVHFDITPFPGYGILANDSGENAIDKLLVQRCVFCGNESENETDAIAFVQTAATDNLVVTNLVLSDCIFSNFFDGILFASFHDTNTDTFSSYTIDDVNISNCLFQSLGGNGIEVDERTSGPMIVKHKTVTSSLIHELKERLRQRFDNAESLASFAVKVTALQKISTRACTGTENRTIKNIIVKSNTFKNIDGSATILNNNLANGIAINSELENDLTCVQNILILDCIFAGITTQSPGSISNAGNGIAIVLSNGSVDTITIQNSTFCNLEKSVTGTPLNAGNGIAINSLGAIGNITTDNCSFTNITGINNGGNAGNGVVLATTSTINNLCTTDCTFDTITGDGTTNAGNGIAACAGQTISDITTTNCNFTDLNGSDADNNGNCIVFVTNANIENTTTKQCNFKRTNGNTGPGKPNAGNGIAFCCNTAINILYDECNFLLIDEAAIRIAATTLVANFISAQCKLNDVESGIELTGNDTLTTARNILVENNQIQKAVNGILIQAEDISQISVSNSILSDIRIIGISFNQSAATTSQKCVQIVNCQLQGSHRESPTSTGVELENFTTAIIRNCSANCFFNDQDNEMSRGFYLNNCLNVCVVDTTAKGNGVGFEFNSTNNQMDGIVRNSSAEGNIHEGFKTTDVGSLEFYRNVSCLNGTNYDVTGIVVTDPDLAQPYENVDCGLSS